MTHQPTPLLETVAAPATAIRTLVAAACMAALSVAAPSAMAVTDPAGDFLGTFAGSHASTDLDVVSASVTFDAAADAFTLTSTFSGPVGLTPTALYVWGVNRGAGTAAFADAGLPNVLFDSVILLQTNGFSLITADGKPATAVTFSGNTLTAIVSGKDLPTTTPGVSEADYTWNLWPRDTAVGSGFTAIADFAPNDTDLATTAAAVPEPETYALMLGGLGILAWTATRQKRAIRRG